MADSSVNNTFMFDALKCVWDIGKAALAVTSPPVSAGMSITEAVVTFGSGAGKNRSSIAQREYDSYAVIFSRLMKAAFDETLKKCGMETLPQRYQSKILREVLAWDDETCIGRYRALALSDKYGQSSKVPEQLPIPNMIRTLTLNILQARSLDIRFGSMPADLDALSRKMTDTLIISLYSKLCSNPFYSTLFQNDEIIRSEDSARQQRDRMEEKQDEAKEQLDRIEGNQGEAKEQLNRMEDNQGEFKAVLGKVDERTARIEEQLDAYVRELRNAAANGSLYGKASDGQTYTIVERPDPECFRNSIRRLSDRLFINWNTGCLASSHSLARADSGVMPVGEGCRDRSSREDSEAVPAGDGISSGQFRYELEPDEVRLLSVLVQGEGAVVGWKELGTRSRAGLKAGTEDDGSQASEGIASEQEQEKLTEAEYKYYKKIYEDDRRGIILCTDEYRSFLRDVLGLSAED